MQRATLEVNDCVLRAPFAGEIADARRRSGRVRAPGHRGRDAGRPHDGAGRRPRCPRPTSTSCAPARRCSIVRWRPTASCAATIARRSPAADLGDAHRPLRDRHPRSRAARCPSARPPSSRIDVGEPVAATEIPLVAAVGARRQGDGLRRRRQTSRTKGVVRRSRASAAAASSSIPRCAGQPRRDRRARAAQGRRPRRGAARTVGAAPSAKLAGSKP